MRVSQPIAQPLRGCPCPAGHFLTRPRQHLCPGAGGRRLGGEPAAAYLLSAALMSLTRHRKYQVPCRRSPSRAHCTPTRLPVVTSLHPHSLYTPKIGIGSPLDSVESRVAKGDRSTADTERLTPRRVSRRAAWTPRRSAHHRRRMSAPRKRIVDRVERGCNDCVRVGVLVSQCRQQEI